MSFAAAPCHMTERYSKRKSRISLIMPLRNRFMKIAIDIRALMEGKTTGVEVYLVNLLHELFKIDSKNQYVLFANSFRAVSLPPGAGFGMLLWITPRLLAARKKSSLFHTTLKKIWRIYTELRTVKSRWFIQA